MGKWMMHDGDVLLDAVVRTGLSEEGHLSSHQKAGMESAMWLLGKGYCRQRGGPR